MKQSNPPVQRPVVKDEEQEARVYRHGRSSFVTPTRRIPWCTLCCVGTMLYCEYPQCVGFYSQWHCLCHYCECFLAKCSTPEGFWCTCLKIECLGGDCTACAVEHQCCCVDCFCSPNDNVSIPATCTICFITATYKFNPLCMCCANIQQLEESHTAARRQSTIVGARRPPPINTSLPVNKSAKAHSPSNASPRHQQRQAEHYSEKVHSSSHSSPTSRQSAVTAKAIGASSSTKSTARSTPRENESDRRRREMESILNDHSVELSFSGDRFDPNGNLLLRSASGTQLVVIEDAIN